MTLRQMANEVSHILGQALVRSGKNIPSVRLLKDQVDAFAKGDHPVLDVDDPVELSRGYRTAQVPAEPQAPPADVPPAAPANPAAAEPTDTAGTQQEPPTTE